MGTKIKVGLEPSGALLHCLQSAKPTGRSALRSHSHVMRALRESCFEKKTVMNQAGQAVETETLKKEGGSLAIDGVTDLKYLKDVVSQQIDAGVPGNISEGYCDLWDAVEAAEKEGNEVLKEANK